MDKKLKLVLDVVYVVGSLVGATLIASNSGHNVLGYVCFFVSSIAGTWLLLKSNASKSLLFINAYYALVNLVGIIRY